MNGIIPAMVAWVTGQHELADGLCAQREQRSNEGYADVRHFLNTNFVIDPCKESLVDPVFAMSRRKQMCDTATKTFYVLEEPMRGIICLMHLIVDYAE
jgi:hypothetical protein